jgi:hypothetical protein
MLSPSVEFPVLLPMKDGPGLPPSHEGNPGTVGVVAQFRSL